jgi:hypothetical protein
VLLSQIAEGDQSMLMDAKSRADRHKAGYANHGFGASNPQGPIIEYVFMRKITILSAVMNTGLPTTRVAAAGLLGGGGSIRRAGDGSEVLSGFRGRSMTVDSGEFSRERTE